MIGSVSEDGCGEPANEDTWIGVIAAEFHIRAVQVYLKIKVTAVVAGLQHREDYDRFASINSSGLSLCQTKRQLSLKPRTVMLSVK